MKVKDVMTTDVIHVDKDVDMKYVMKLMKKNNITKIPVVEDKKPIGLITDSNLAIRSNSYSRSTSCSIACIIGYG